MALDWRGWTYLVVIITAIIGFGGYGLYAGKPWALWTGVTVAAAFICFVLWLANAMNTDI